MKGWGTFACLVSFGLYSPAFAQDPCDFVMSPPSLQSNKFRFSFNGESETYYAIESSTNLQNWSPVADVLMGGFTRTIDLSTSAPSAYYRVSRGPWCPFIGALVARQTVSLQSGSFTDSYDSMDPTHSTIYGTYDPATRKAGGHVCVDGGSIILNANIYGKLIVGPNGSYSIGPNASVGDLGWVGPGIQPGWYSPDFRLCFAEVKPPFASGLTPTGSGTNTYVLASVDYLLDSLQLVSSQTLYVQGNARLWVKGSLQMLGTSKIVIAPGASLKLFVGMSAGSPNAASLAQVNVSDYNNALSFQIFGLPTTASIAWSGNANFLGIIYAPAASVSLGGGGSTLYDYQGGVAAKSINLNGHFAVHFDENLKRRVSF